MTIRWGIVTAGKISHDFVNALNSFPQKGDQVVAAVAARDKTRAAEFAKLHGISKVFDTYEAMAASKDIDIAYIGSLIPDHYSLAKTFLANGKHVLCEKPLTLNAKQTESLLRFAKEKKLFLMEAVWSRFCPAYKVLDKELNSGKLGDVQFVEVDFGEHCAEIERIRRLDLGGSAILDLGIYVLQFAQLIFKDEPIKVTTVGELNENGVDVANTVILEYTGGRRAVLNANAKVKLWNKATVYGTKGHITMDEPFHFPTKMIHVDGKVEEFPLHTTKYDRNFINSAGLAYQTLEVCRCIKEGLLESPLMSHRESLLLAKLMDTVRKGAGAHFDADDQEFP